MILFNFYTILSYGTVTTNCVWLFSNMQLNNVPAHQFAHNAVLQSKLWWAWICVNGDSIMWLQHGHIGFEQWPAYTIKFYGTLKLKRK